MTVTIDCSEIRENADLHRIFSSQLHLPGFYGKNLDALYDCLTSLPQKTTLNLLHTQSLIDNLGPYGRAAISAIAHAERENPARLTVNMK
ncbi:MAG: barstar family protein [Oscillospiraceae bacterium]|nr:barstar family protein [Oscillospiraceae bacterium]MBR3449048.1 barstar family protein [Oscillospiraceae bacterium]